MKKELREQFTLLLKTGEEKKKQIDGIEFDARTLIACTTSSLTQTFENGVT